MTTSHRGLIGEIDARAPPQLIQDGPINLLADSFLARYEICKTEFFSARAECGGETRNIGTNAQTSRLHMEIRLPDSP